MTLIIIFLLINKIKDIEKAYVDDNGYVKSGQYNLLLSEIENYLIEQKQKGNIKDFFKDDDNHTIGVTLNSGIQYIYSPNIAGLDSTSIKREIATYQPVNAGYSQDLQEMAVCVDDSAEKISQLSDDDHSYSYVKNNSDKDNDFNDGEVTIESLKSLSKFGVILWHGHGGYDTQHHSFLVTGEIFNQTQYLLNPVYFINLSADLISGRIVVCAGDRLAVTSTFFDKYLENMNGALVYLGACSSGKDDMLANSFINKGASTVFANSDVIHTEYNLKMIKEIANALVVQNSTGQYNTVTEALTIAQGINGGIDIVKENIGGETNIYINSNTKVKIIGNNDLRLIESSENNTTATTKAPTQPPQTTPAPAQTQPPQVTTNQVTNKKEYMTIDELTDGYYIKRGEK